MDIFTVCSFRLARCPSSVDSGNRFIDSEFKHFQLTRGQKEIIGLPGVRFNSPSTVLSSTLGFEPSRSCAAAEERELAFGSCGLPTRLPARELLTELGLLDGTPLRGAGGMDWARVEICSAGNFSNVRGSTSSRFTGIPSDIRCCLRVRDLVQFTGCIGGVFDGSSVL